MHVAQPTSSSLSVGCWLDQLAGGYRGEDWPSAPCVAWPLIPLSLPQAEESIEDMRDKAAQNLRGNKKSKAKVDDFAVL